LSVFSINRDDSIPCQTAYPAARQTGIGWSINSDQPYGTPVVQADGIGQISDPLYCWNDSGPLIAEEGNSYVGLNQYTPDQCGNGELIGTFLQEGRDYFVGTAMPGWTPYTYPHPLHSAYASGNPTGTPASTPPPPQNLRVVP
jgi:hypothetical protein